MNFVARDAIASGGTSFVWDADELSKLANPSEIYSLREFFLVRNWDEVTDLPSYDNNLLVVGGLDAALKCMSHEDALKWLQTELKPRIQAFHSRFQLQSGLCFFLSCSPNEIAYNASEQDYLMTLHDKEAPIPLLTPVFGGYREEVFQIVRQAEKAKNAKQKDGEQVGVQILR